VRLTRDGGSRLQARYRYSAGPGLDVGGCNDVSLSLDAPLDDQSKLDVLTYERTLDPAGSSDESDVDALFHGFFPSGTCNEGGSSFEIAMLTTLRSTGTRIRTTATNGERCARPPDWFGAAGLDYTCMTSVDLFRISKASAGDDSLRGTRRSERLCGLAGDDTLVGLGGRDRLFGDACGRRRSRGNDYLDGGAGDDTLVGGRGKDQLIGAAGADRIRPGPGPDYVLAMSGNDVILARDGRHDFVDCGRGRDVVVADAADELLRCERRR
jgi:Ca2+-binding RTX toxin-like protein